MDDAEVQWLAGFSNGDFSIAVSTRPSANSIGWRCAVKLAWSQNEVPYVAGFVDADGAIKIRVSKSDMHHLGYTTSPDICIDSSDADVIKKIKKILNDNNINTPEHHSFSNRGIPMNRLEVTKLTDVRKILELIRPYLVGRKRIQVEMMLNTALPIFEKGEHLTKEGFIKIMEIRDMMVLSKKKDIREHTADYFKKLWSIGV